MASISVYQARAELSRLIERALGGRGDRDHPPRQAGGPPVPVEQARRASPGALKGMFTVTESSSSRCPTTSRRVLRSKIYLTKSESH